MNTREKLLKRYGRKTIPRIIKRVGGFHLRNSRTLFDNWAHYRLPNGGTVQVPTTRYSSGADPGSVAVPDNNIRLRIPTHNVFPY
jgi:hypothetical protein